MFVCRGVGNHCRGNDRNNNCNHPGNRRKLGGEAKRPAPLDRGCLPKQRGSNCDRQRGTAQERRHAAQPKPVAWSRQQ